MLLVGWPPWIEGRNWGVAARLRSACWHDLDLEACPAGGFLRSSPVRTARQDDAPPSCARAHRAEPRASCASNRHPRRRFRLPSHTKPARPYRELLSSPLREPSSSYARPSTTVRREAGSAIGMLPRSGTASGMSSTKPVASYSARDDAKTVRVLPAVPPARKNPAPPRFSPALHGARRARVRNLPRRSARGASSTRGTFRRPSTHDPPRAVAPLATATPSRLV